MADVIDNKAKQPSSGTGFTNLSRVLNANQNNRLGSTINSGVSNVVGQANTNLNQAQNQFGEQSQKGSVGSDQDKQYVSNTLKDPSQAQQADYDKFARFRQGYQGPQGLQSDTLQGQQQELNSLGGLTQSSGGRQALLQRFVGSPQYNQGQQKLDTLLLGQGGNLNNLRRQTQQANQNINQGYDTAANQANMLKAQSAGFGQDVSNQLSGAQTAQNTDLTNRAAQYTTQEQALHDVLSNFLTPVKAGAATPTGGNSVSAGFAGGQTMTGPNSINQDQYNQAMAALGRAGQSGQDLLNQNFYGASAVEGFDPNSILGGTINPYTSSQVATSQDLAKAQALSKLSGEQNPTGLAGQTADQLGGYNPLSFLDNSNLQKYENLGKQQYDTAQGKIQAGNQYKADVNEVADIARRQGQIMDEANLRYRDYQNQNSGTNGKNIEDFFTPEQKTKMDDLQNQRMGLVNKQSLMSGYNTLANYRPTTYSDPYSQSYFDQQVAQRLGSADTANAAQQPIVQKYNSSTIGDRLKALLQQDQPGINQAPNGDNTFNVS